MVSASNQDDTELKKKNEEEIAKKMLQEGMNVTIIQKLTDLSLNEIDILKKEIEE